MHLDPDTHDYLNQYMDENTPQNEVLPVIYIYVSAGLGRRKYLTQIREDGTFTLPESLAKEIRFRPGDELIMQLDLQNLTLYISVEEKEWEAPTWMA
jgi:hypothetical protein